MIDRGQRGGSIESDALPTQERGATNSRPPLQFEIGDRISIQSRRDLWPWPFSLLHMTLRRARLARRFGIKPRQIPTTKEYIITDAK